ncbi:guanylate-binding protein 1-like [Chanos chanos]|uniref:Guanylate-binding protein 1-like n=1 Tax=Chanos chanos TaxID=29144 RepID=A0A6J2W5R0_CHACN|nr:guanylate-binding protein 1-like [Chanos chanos]
MTNQQGPMKSPMCLIKNVDGLLRTEEKALEHLRGISQPVVVVAVVGLYRTGKSYLMNRLAGKQTGFALGRTIESKTKGIWMWCVPHPTKTEHTLVLLDTEGLGDVDKGDSKNDAWIFCLAVLLSSTLVYNSRGTIDNQAVEKLHYPFVYVTELTDQIKVKSASASSAEYEEEEESQFVQFFPNFVWAVRDFTLERKINDEDVTEDQYLEFALTLKKGMGKSVINYNLPRQCIRNYFPSRKCFTFPFPTAPENMCNLEQLDVNDLFPKFLETADRFCKYIFKESRVKTVKGGHRVNGRLLSHLVETYVNTIASGGVPCLENAVVAMAQIENQAAVQKGFHVYESGMEQVKNNFPLELNEIFPQHQDLNTMAIQVFMKRSFKDEQGVHLKALAEAIDKHYARLLLQNEEASERKCQKLLMDLYAPMAKKLQDGCYAQPGGYELYCGDRNNVVTQYRNHSKKGVRAEDVLEMFMKDKSMESNAVLQADKKLTENERRIQEEKERAALMEQKIRAEQERQEEMKKTLEEERQSQKERLKQMEEKIEEEKCQQQKEMELAMESKLREQKDLLENGFKEKAELLGEEIQQLKKEKAANFGGIFKDYVMPLLKIAVDVGSNILQYKVLSKVLK